MALNPNRTLAQFLGHLSQVTDFRNVDGTVCDLLKGLRPFLSLVYQSEFDDMVLKADADAYRARNAQSLKRKAREESSKLFKCNMKRARYSDDVVAANTNAQAWFVSKCADIDSQLVANMTRIKGGNAPLPVVVEAPNEFAG
ncbi:expressed unknown protein [Seminavis robusta]|uniref:Uncharacterized protein n=1 Tax=Seminavis robusta TaxID=568900 RepID=A0A9N8EXU0_9STRA|nr:expressed unknown protein [Seminavis robusta]|eukprot:Sro2390_g096041.1  (142) ;mRNA; f:141-644